MVARSDEGEVGESSENEKADEWMDKALGL